MLYFIVHSDTLSVFKKSSDNDSVHLKLKIKFHHNLISIDNNSKLLSSVIAQALDELGEKIDLENKHAAIAIDDSILSHSLNTISKKNQSSLSQYIKRDLQDKWKELFRNYFSISESKKSSKNIFHTVEMNHYLREKIKLNFNNSGIDIKFLVPMSSILLSGAKSTQYVVNKSSRIYSVFNYSKKGFSFYRGSFTGKNKKLTRIIGLADMVKFKEKDFKDPNLKYIMFNDVKIVEFFAKIIKDSTPILNFIKPFGVQILDDQKYRKTILNLDKGSNYNFSQYAKNTIAGFLTLGLVVLALIRVSDFNFLYNETSINTKDSKAVETTSAVRTVAVKPAINQVDKYLASSHASMDEFQVIANSANISKIQSIIILDNHITINTGSNDGISGTYTIKSSKVASLQSSMPIYDLLSVIVEKGNSNQFEHSEGLFFDKKSDNVIIRCEGLDGSIEILEHIRQYDNLISRKIVYNKIDNSVHLYVTVLKV